MIQVLIKANELRNAILFSSATNNPILRCRLYNENLLLDNGINTPQKIPTNSTGSSTAWIPVGNVNWEKLYHFLKPLEYNLIDIKISPDRLFIYTTKEF